MATLNLGSQALGSPNPFQIYIYIHRHIYIYIYLCILFAAIVQLHIAFHLCLSKPCDYLLFMFVLLALPVFVCSCVFVLLVYLWTYIGVYVCLSDHRNEHSLLRLLHYFCSFCNAKAPAESRRLSPGERRALREFDMGKMKLENLQNKPKEQSRLLPQRLGKRDTSIMHSVSMQQFPRVHCMLGRKVHGLVVWRELPLTSRSCGPSLPVSGHDALRVGV